MSRMLPLVLLAQAAVCFWIWQSMDRPNLTGILALEWCLTSAAASFLLFTFSGVRARFILPGVAGAAVLANIANIVLGVSKDPSSHNLYPLELAITVAISLVGVAVGSVFAGAIRRKR
jgi:hypothetical protein